MNLNFDFLRNVQLVTPVAEPKGRVAVVRNPEGLRLRVFSNGKVFPSAELVEKYKLEYAPKDSTDEVFGFDVFKSTDWPMFPMNESTPKFVFIAPTQKSSPRVDLFGQVAYNEDGSPKTSVLEQGGSFGLTILEMIKDIYGIEVAKGESIDLEINEDVVVKSPNGVYYIPKTIARGENKGEQTVVRRELISVMPLVPVVGEVSTTAIEEVEVASINTEIPEIEETPAPYSEGEGETEIEKELQYPELG